MSASPVRRYETFAIAAIAILFIVVLPLLNARGVIDDFTINLWGKYLCYALLAISVDLLWGYTGLLSLGQALFFSLGGYMHGMYLMRMIGDLGQHKKPIPDFLVFLGWTELSAFWNTTRTAGDSELGAKRTVTRPDGPSIGGTASGGASPSPHATSPPSTTTTAAIRTA